MFCRGCVVNRCLVSACLVECARTVKKLIMGFFFFFFLLVMMLYAPRNHIAPY